MSSKTHHRGLPALVAAAVAALAGSAAFGQTTQPVTWVDTTTNDYNNAASWSSNQTPLNASHEFLQINNGGTATLSGSANYEGAWLNLGVHPGESGHLQIDGGTLTVGELRVGGRETIATDMADWGAGVSPNGGGTGSVVQGGTSAVRVNFSTGTEPPIQSMYVGDSGLDSGNTAVGSYTIKDSATLVNGIATNDQLVIGTGPGAQGTFLQQDTSSVSSTGTLVVGRRGATGSYTLQGGTLSTGGAVRIGDAETPAGATAGTSGTFTQSGISTFNSKAMDVGRLGGTGTYSISSGTLNLGGQLSVGTTASSTVPGTLNSTGTFNLSDTGNITTTLGNNVFVGFNGASATFSATPTSTGTFNMTGGTMTLSNTLFIVGSGTGATGTANISGGTLQNATGTNVEYDIGRNAGTGTMNISGTAVVKGNTFLIGASGSIGNSGTLAVSGGSLTTNNITLSSSELTGANPVRTLNISGGTVTTGTLNQGSANAPTVTRSVNVTGGSLTATGATTGGRLVTYNLSGGTSNFQGIFSLDTSTLNISNTAGVTFGTFRTQSGITNITGGSTTIANVNDANNEGGVTTISGGTVNVTGLWNVTNATPATAGQLNISGGNVTINSLTTGGSVTLNSSLNISGGTVSIPTMTLSTGSTLKTDNAISLGSAITLGNATVNVNSGSLALTGGITLPSGGRTLTKTGSGPLTISGPWTFNATPGSSTINENAGTLNLNSAIGGNGNMTVNANSTTNFGANAGLAALNVGAGTTATLVNNGSANRVINAANVAINATGRLDLKNNKLITNVAPGASTAGTYSGLQREVQRAYDFGAWDQPGLTTSEANAAAGLTTIGVATGAQVRGLGATDTDTFAGQTINGASTIAMYTYAGDANLDGVIDGGDYGIIDNFAQIPGADSYANGDFNYDGVIDGGDYGIIDNNIQAQGTPFPTGGAVEASSLSGVTAVPEPSAFGFAILTAASVLGVRRRRATK